MFAKGIFINYGVLGIGLRLESLPEGVTLLIRNLQKKQTSMRRREHSTWCLQVSLLPTQSVIGLLFVSVSDLMVFKN